MHKIYTEKPKAGNARKAWEKFEKEEGYPPSSVSYTPSYQYQYRGWVCEMLPDGALTPNCLERPLHKFYMSCDL